MGFRTGAWGKVWEVTPVSDTSTKIRISTSRKDKQTNEWKDDFSGYVMCVGTAAASKAAKLQKGDRIKLGDVDVTTTYNEERKTTYTNFRLFSFETSDDGQAAPAAPAAPVSNSGSGRDLPF